MAGVNLVVGFRPDLWRELRPKGIPRDIRGFDQNLEGAEGFVMPATQHDAVLWFSGSALDAVFDEARSALRALGTAAVVATETVGWPYQRDRDLTGFIDGIENPTLSEAAEVVLIPAGRPGEGGSVLLLQQWRHLAGQWDALPQSRQERVIGRRKPSGIELANKPSNSHVSKTDQDQFGKIFRRNVAYGNVTEHGTLFVGFCRSRRPLASMLDSMAGRRDGVRDALTNYTKPITGAYYFVPSLDALREFGGAT